MTTLLSFVFSKTGLYVGIALAIFLAGFVVCWKFTHRAGKTIEQTFSVVSVANGATINVKAGLLPRATKPIFLQGISAPGLNDPLGPESRDNLTSLAGNAIRVESEKQGLLMKPVIGDVFGSTGKDLAIAQLQAGLATCETSATKPQIAAQKQAQAAKRGLWANTGGSHWWNFSVATLGDFSNFRSPIPEKSMFDPNTLILWLAWLAIAVSVACLAWTYVIQPLASKWTAAATVTAVVDTTEQIAAYCALSQVIAVPAVAADPQAVTACDYLRNVVTKWPSLSSTSTPATKS